MTDDESSDLFPGLVAAVPPTLVAPTERKVPMHPI